MEVVWRLCGVGVPTSKSAGSHGRELVTEAQVSHSEQPTLKVGGWVRLYLWKGGMSQTLGTGVKTTSDTLR